MKCYLVIMGESFDAAVKAHKDGAYVSIEDARDCALLLLPPNSGFMVCDENGGVYLIGRTPSHVGVA